MPFCKIATGNAGEGMAESQSLKSGCTVSASIVSQMTSSFGIHDSARWQFCKHTHMPSSIAFSIIASALGPWPWPSDTWSNRESISFSSHSFSKSAIGSAPEESTKINGASTRDSEKQASRSNGGGSMNRWPSLPDTKSVTPSMNRSGRMQRITRSFWNSFNLSLKTSSSGNR